MKIGKDIVVFRTFSDGQVIALFPRIRFNSNSMLSYMHLGQHAIADPSVVSITRLATEEEYKPLYDEMKSIGYNLTIKKRLMNYERF